MVVPSVAPVFLVGFLVPFLVPPCSFCWASRRSRMSSKLSMFENNGVYPSSGLDGSRVMAVVAKPRDARVRFQNACLGNGTRPANAPYTSSEKQARANAMAVGITFRPAFIPHTARNLGGNEWRRGVCDTDEG